MTLIQVTGFDPSLRHWGIASGFYDSETKLVTINSLAVIEPVLPKGKQVRQNSKDLEAGYQLATAAISALSEAQAVFVEIPQGSQSARGATGYGVCVGVLGTIRAQGKAFYEVTPTEVKLVTGNKTATKQDMIAWATAKHPEAPWPKHKKNGQWLITTSQAEHMADAIAAIYAGIASAPFQQMQLLIQAA